MENQQPFVNETHPMPSAGGTRAFFMGAWKNRRYTRSISSFLLGCSLSIPFTIVLVNQPDVDPIASVTVTVICVLNTLLFPLNREMYFRVTAPIREGMGGASVSGPLVLVVLYFRLVILVCVWSFSIPLTTISLPVLAVGEARGNGWRYE